MIENTTEHPIDINLMKDGVPTTFTVPAGKQEGSLPFVVGVLRDVDASVVDAGVKASPVVKHYFDSGMLRHKK